MIQALQQSCLEDHLLDLTPSEVPGEGLLQGVGGAPPCRDRQDSRVPGERGRPGGGGAWQGWCWSQLGQYSWASAGSEPSAWELYLPQRRWYLQPQATVPGARERVGKGGPVGPGVTSGFSSFPDAGPPPEPWQPPEAEPHMGASASACMPMAGEPPLAGPGCSQLGLQPEPSLGALDLTILYKGRTVLQEVVGRPSCVLLYGPSGVAVLSEFKIKPFS